MLFPQTRTLCDVAWSDDCKY